MSKAVIYIRVSSEGQNTARQESALKKWVAEFDHVETFIDRLSGATPFAQREVWEYLEANPDATTLVVHDLDRLGRDAIDVQTTIKKLRLRGCNVIINRYGLPTILEDGSENPAAKMMVAMLSTFAEMEREKIRDRQREGIELAKKQGKYKGRKKGTTESRKAFLAKHKAVVRELKTGTSVRKTAKLCDVSPATVQKVKNYMAA